MAKSVPIVTVDGTAFLKALGLTALFAEHGFKINCGQAQASIFDKTGDLLHTLPVPVGVVHAVIQGEAGNLLKKTLTEAIGKTVAYYAKGEGAKSKVTKATMELADLIGEAQAKGKPVVTATQAAKAKGNDVIPVIAALGIASKTFPVSDLMTADPVQLVAATALYQPVRSTGDHSRYFLVAAGPALAVGARLMNGQLSVRVEGMIKACHARLVECGFSKIKPRKGYASVHLQVGSLMVANKTLGAILLGLQIEAVTPMPNLAVIEGKGS